MSDTPPAGRPDDPVPPDVPCDAWEACGARALASRWAVPAVHLYETVGSTNDVARRLASAGAEPGTLVLAERQLTGRGRAGRAWESPPRLGIWLSMIMSPPADADAAGVLPLRAGTAIARAVEPFVHPRRVGLKWPNDLLVDGLKLGGILCEGVWVGSAAGPVVVGVGLNALQREEDLPRHLRGLATSVRLSAGSPVERLAIADAVVTALVADLQTARATPEALAAELARRDVLRGRIVEVTDPDTGERRVRGMATGIAPDGALLVQPEAEAAREIRSGTVRLAGSSLYSSRSPSGA